MSRFLLDIAVTSLLDSCLVAAQALVLNRLGIPFAAITAFSGIGAYAVALSLNGSWAILPSTLLLGALMAIGFSALSRPLPQDRYLLLTLAVLGVLRATAGTVPALGGQLGMSSASTALPPQQSLPFALVALVLFAAALVAHALIERSEFGLAISVARIARTDIAASAFVPVKKIALACFTIASLIAIFAGALKALYAGRVDPDQFRIRTAVILLMATLVVGSSPLRIGLLSLAFFAFPDLFGAFFGYNTTALAFIREMVWSVLIITLVSRRFVARPAARIADSTAAGTGG
jgi:ABC-type branched-subunit amino acid transport system permease subunit